MSNSKQVVSWLKRTKERMVKSFGSKCCVCGKTYPVEVFDFHHIDPNKKTFKISGKTISWVRMAGELRKCVMVCSNCHRMIHSGYSAVPEDASRFDEDFAARRTRAIKKRHYNKCPVCNGDKLVERKWCSAKCRSIGRRKVERPSKGQLIELMKTGSWSSLGRMFCVSDNAVRKWAKSYDIFNQ